ERAVRPLARTSKQAYPPRYVDGDGRSQRSNKPLEARHCVFRHSLILRKAAKTMNTFWLKLAGLAVLVIVGIVIIGMIASKSEPKSEKPETGFYDQIEKDKQKFLQEPRPQNANATQPAVQPNRAPAPQPVIQPVQPAIQPTTLYFKELPEIDKIEAERLLNVAVPGRSIGRLPMTGFKLMVDNCRVIIKRWPESWYAYRAQQLLIDMPERYHFRYKVTEQEMDLSRFAVQRPGTKPFVMEEDR
ncbi:MAG: hypothetical protein JSU94_08620, partial [Phycisphaerales bacterium]